MGKIYEQAEVTIAASDAWDSTRGLFLTCSSLPPPLEIPFMDPISQEQKGSYFISLPPSFGNIDPEKSVLNSRAWATQEWLLSRRMIHFLSGGTVVSLAKLLPGLFLSPHRLFSISIRALLRLLYVRLDDLS
jgi:hypothetical protein